MKLSPQDLQSAKRYRILGFAFLLTVGPFVLLTHTPAKRPPTNRDIQNEMSYLNTIKLNLSDTPYIGQEHQQKSITDEEANYIAQRDVRKEAANKGFTIVTWGTTGGCIESKWTPLVIKDNVTGTQYSSDDMEALEPPKKYPKPITMQ